MRLGTHQGGTKMVLILKGWGVGVEDFSHRLSAEDFQAKLSSSDLSLRDSTFPMPTGYVPPAWSANIFNKRRKTQIELVSDFYDCYHQTSRNF